MSEIVQVTWTCANVEEANKIATMLVENRLVGCVNIIPNVFSIYSWEGKIESVQEVEVIMKTKKELFSPLKDFIEENCSYDVPAILMLPIIEGNASYLEWLSKATR